MTNPHPNPSLSVLLSPLRLRASAGDGFDLPQTLNFFAPWRLPVPCEADRPWRETTSQRQTQSFLAQRRKHARLQRTTIRPRGYAPI